MIAGIPQAPTYYSPYGDHVYSLLTLADEEVFRRAVQTEADVRDLGDDLIQIGLLGKAYTFQNEAGDTRSIYIKGRTDLVLDRMKTLGYISELQYTEAVDTLSTLTFKPNIDQIEAPHFVFYVRELLEEQYGKTKIEQGGLRITTSLDLDLQKKTEAIVSEYRELNETRYGATNASVVAVDPNNGQILAMVGSADYWDTSIDGNVNVALRPRLPGSSFKPIAYAAAFLQGYSPSTVVYDVKTKFGEWYEPNNFDGTFRGPVSFRQALASSLNIPAIKAAHLAGIPNVLNLARRMGIQLNQPDDWYGLSLALGAGEARLLDMAMAYSIFSAGGYKVDPVAILKVEERSGSLLQEYTGPKNRELILDPQVAYLINDILSDVNARPEGFWRSRLTVPGQINAAKTGTSNSEKKTENDKIFPKDTWVLGYTRAVTVGVWAGNSDGTPMNNRASGLDTAGRIWADVMAEATRNHERTPFERPEGIRWVRVSKKTGKLPSANTPEDQIETGVFASFSVLNDYDDSYNVVKIDKVSGKLATEFTPPAAIEEKAFFEHKAIIPHPQWQQAIDKWAAENGQDEKPPTEYDDVHTAENASEKPTIILQSPTALSTVSPPFIEVIPQFNPGSLVEYVEYYWDDQLLQTVRSAPYYGRLQVPRTLPEGETHTIRAIVYDRSLRSNQASVEVRIGKDQTPPSLSFVYPESNAPLLAGSSIPVQLNAFDGQGAVTKVELYLEGELVATLRTPPYTAQITLPERPGTYTLLAVATDYQQNETREKKTLSVQASLAGVTPSSFGILQPRPNAYFDSEEAVFVEVAFDDDSLRSLKQVLLLGKKQDAGLFTIAEADPSGLGERTTFSWNQPEPGIYDLSVKLLFADGTFRYSDKVRVVIR
ncbi:hypothetical protein IPJ72_00045 [Candidatus Peregrinibacteria bacterium]|nr:MAG: hypothetical protein IPJ72_00045 [Candidatus Peregrinibacteria bacterium]